MNKELKAKFLKFVSTAKSKLFLLSAVCAFFVALFTCFVILFTGSVEGSAETAKELVLLNNKIREHYKMRPDFWGLNTQEVINNRLYSATISSADGKLSGTWGKEIIIGSDESGSSVMPTQKTFAVAYKGLSKERCVALASSEFEENFWFGIEKILIFSAEQKQFFHWGSDIFGLPVNKKDVEKVCKNENIVVFFFQ